MVAVARALATCAERDGDGLTALHAHRRVLEVDSYDDHAHRGTVRLLEALGAHGQAEAARRRHCEALAELGLVAD
jgi:hypothetical protein